MANLLLDMIDYFKERVPGNHPYYADTMLDEAGKEKAVAIYEYAGQTSRPQINSVHRSLQVAVRSPQASDSRALCLLLYKSLQSEDGIIQVTDARWGMVALRQPPFKLKVDEKGRHHFVFNLGMTTEIL